MINKIHVINLFRFSYFYCRCANRLRKTNMMGKICKLIKFYQLDPTYASMASFFLVYVRSLSLISNNDLASKPYTCKKKKKKKKCK